MHLSTGYLGHVISGESVSPDLSLCQFLGLTSYYRRFVQEICHLLVVKGMSISLRYTYAVMAVPVLMYPRFGPKQEFVIETDASLDGLGAVLGHKQKDGPVHPVA